MKAIKVESDVKVYSEKHAGFHKWINLSTMHVNTAFRKSSPLPNVPWDTPAKRNQRRNADVKRKSKPADRRIEDTVLIRQKPRHKLDAPLNPAAGTLIKKNGSTITVEHNGKQFRRDASHFKPVQTDVQDRRRNVHNGSTIPTRRSQRQKRRPPRRFED
ncbi:hypothetical protein DPMN_092819 [Dreissena polymorpha]|uniref:Uncharacterized protein n=1 Tax=Dreissena polymorpha TaxID=45954 RepID=A0A9D4R191_DREPO|nr:hypothetical protein DPMN_092819 [Dreissena polymorpha]